VATVSHKALIELRLDRKPLSHKGDAFIAVLLNKKF
jgi:hypothetical protein